MADRTGRPTLPHELDSADRELRDLLQGERERIGNRRDWVVPLDAHVPEAARRYVVALRDVDGGRQELLRRARLIETMTADGSDFSEAWQNARPLLGDTVEESPSDWRNIVDESRGTGLLDVIHLRNVISNVGRVESDPALHLLAQLAQQIIDEAERVHTDGCRALLLIATTQTSADDIDLQPFFNSLPDLDALRHCAQTPKAPMLILAAVESLTAWAGQQAASHSGDGDDDGVPAEYPKRAKDAQEANERAMEIAGRDPYFARNPNVRQWAARINTSTGTVSKLPFYNSCADEAGTSRSSKRPKAVSLTPKVEARAGAADAELERLMGEQSSDFEPSPLDDTPHPPPRARKRL